MNLHGMAGPIVGAVNPQIPVTVKVSTGSVVDAAGKRTPTYAPDVTLLGQVQPVSWRDIQMIEGLNLQGVRWKIYLNGQVDGLVRPERKGGDLVVIRTGRHQGTWLVAVVLEQYPDWVCAGITQQNES